MFIKQHINYLYGNRKKMKSCKFLSKDDRRTKASAEPSSRALCQHN